MWVKAVEKVKSTDPDKVIAALPGIEAPNLTGGIVDDAAEPSHHQAGVRRRSPCRRPVRRGVEDARAWCPGDAWSDFLPGSKDLEADWVTLKCGNYNKVTKKCGGAS